MLRLAGGSRPCPLSHKRSPQTGPAREVPAPPSARGAEKPPHLFSSFQEFTVLPACTHPTISVLRSEISPTSVTIASEIMMRNNFEAAMDRALGRAGTQPWGHGRDAIHCARAPPGRNKLRPSRTSTSVHMALGRPKGRRPTSSVPSSFSGATASFPSAG